MEFSLPSKKLILLIFLILSGSLISTSIAGRDSKVFTKSLDKENFVEAYEKSNFKGDMKEEMIIHERMLRRMNTNDYGRYDRSPSLPRPRHKLIPN